MKSCLLVLTFFTQAMFSNLGLTEPIWTPMPPQAYALQKLYPEAQSLLFAFDYGHALLYEGLLRRKLTPDPNETAELFEATLLAQVLEILKNPPQNKINEDHIAPEYVHRLSVVVDLFDWSHLLHQYVLDVLASTPDRPSSIELKKREAAINDLFSHYKSKPTVAITDMCKSMLFMDGHPYSKSFRRAFPAYNLLIWSYHWFQIRLYDALLMPLKKDRDLAVAGTISEFKRLISSLPDSAEFDMMPETFKVAPAFSKQFSKIAASFDNNHMMHDIVSDLLTSDRVSPGQIRKEGLRIANLAKDPEAFKPAVCP